MSKDWQEQLQEEEAYEEVVAKLTKRTADLVDAKNKKVVCINYKD